MMGRYCYAPPSSIKVLHGLTIQAPIRITLLQILEIRKNHLLVKIKKKMPECPPSKTLSTYFQKIKNSDKL